MPSVQDLRDAVNVSIMGLNVSEVCMKIIGRRKHTMTKGLAAALLVKIIQEANIKVNGGDTCKPIIRCLENVMLI
jgi:hypothetical protein